MSRFHHAPTDPGARDLAGFLGALAEFEAGLTTSEALALRKVLVAAMDPIERMRWSRDLVLGEREQRIVESLADPDA